MNDFGLRFPVRDRVTIGQGGGIGGSLRLIGSDVLVAGGGGGSGKLSGSWMLIVVDVVGSSEGDGATGLLGLVIS